MRWVAGAIEGWRRRAGLGLMVQGMRGGMAGLGWAGVQSRDML